ncbi:SDR family NAD(P)-dependent oxidoreductase [Thioclava atlantica]|uniref:3-oxoacyl-ACP reductase n=1 Tax=Thioclava atlantica TaxID=1317124 RepID=A0A085TX23_9RHOB|nr:SDR family oxidoreductase [Thioclava atlantica]KFE35270.1 3-oxoacyl-ACP reductase [Thioclava atlantica]
MRATFDFTGTSVLVTGASRGIGLGIAEGFAQAGADLTILSETEEVFEAARGLGAKPLLCDISDRSAVADALSGIDRLDVLVNNAGMERPTPLNGPAPQTDDTFERVIAVNVTGTQNVTRTLAGRISDGGRVILTSSIWGKTSVPEFSAYAASKHAMIGLARTWALELGPRAITVNAVCPGWVMTGAAKASLAAMSRSTGRSEDELLGEVMEAQAIGGIMEPSDMAGLYLFLASDAAANITGQAISIDRGEILQ